MQTCLHVTAGVTTVIYMKLYSDEKNNGKRAKYSVMRLPTEHTPPMSSESKLNRLTGFSVTNAYNTIEERM